MFEPVDYKGAVAGVCGGTPSEDDDKDGFSNLDELANGTNPCSAADLPADLDKDFLSDRIDTDDDDDGLSDKNDPFPLDPANGRGTTLPVSYEWENDSEPAGFLYNLGFSGLMNNGVSDYLDLYSLSNMTTGGAAGVLTIDHIAPGDPVASVNNQSYGFQFGVDVAPSDEPFTVHTRLLLPFAGADLGGHQSMGFFIGSGDQDNYIKLVVNASMAIGGIQFAAERKGKFEQVANVAAPVLAQSQVDLYLRVDPGDLSVRAFYQAGADTKLVEVGSATTFPEAWLTADTALAVGIISTSFGGPTFGATWDFLRVTPGSPGSIDLSHEQDPVAGETGNDAVVQAAVNGVIVIDAEHPVENISAAGHQWVSVGGEGARGNASMVASPDSGLIRFANNDTPHLRYSVNFPSAGDWYVWARGWGDAVGNEGKSDSVHVGIDGKLDTAKGIQGFPAGGWQWSNTRRDGGLAMIRVDSPGKHTIDVWMREDGFELDALLLTQDGSFIPSGPGPDAEQSNDAPDNTGSGSDGDPVADVSPDSGTEEGNETSDEATGSGNNGDGENSNANEVHTDVEGVIAIEAEHHVESIGAAGRQWVIGTRKGAQGNNSMVASPDSGLIRFGNNDTPHLRYSVNFPSAGDWYVWVRGWGDAVGNEGKSDSVHVGVNGELSSAKAIQGFPAGGWQWSNSQRGGGLAMIRVDSPGKHTIDVWMREDGFEFDALLLTLNGSFIPGDKWSGAQHANDTQDTTDTDNENAGDNQSDAESGGDTGSEETDDAVNDGGHDSTAEDDSPGNSIDDGVDADDYVIVIEVENFSSTVATDTHRWISGAKEGASGGSMITTPDAGLLRANASDTPVMRYEVDFPAAGIWRVWVRGWGDAVNGEGKSDSVHVGINSSLAGAKAIQGFPAGGWTWSGTTRGGGFASVQVSSPGLHMIDVWMREDGLEVDALVLTTDTAYIPVGLTDMPGKSGAGDTPDDVNIDTDSGAASVYRAPASRNWISFSNSSGSATPRHEAGAVEFGGKLYLMGGRGSRPIDIYDPTIDAWSQGAKAPLELHHFQPVVVDSEIWVLGAMTCCYPREDNVGYIWTYTPATDNWARGLAIPQSRQRGSAAAVVYEEKIYLIGGNTLGHDGGAVDWFDEFDPSTGNWRTLPDAPVARDHAQAGLVEDKLVLAAGRRSSQPNVFKDTIAQVDVYDFKTGRWSKGADIPTKRAGTMSVTVGREVLVIGGESAGRQTAHASVEAYDIETNDWRLLKPLRQGRHSGGAVRLDNAVHVVAGAVTTGGANETASHERLPLD